MVAHPGRKGEGIQTLLFFHAMETGLNIPQTGAYPSGAFSIYSPRNEAEGAHDKVSSDPQIRTICGEAEVLVTYNLAQSATGWTEYCSPNEPLIRGCVPVGCFNSWLVLHGIMTRSASEILGPGSGKYRWTSVAKLLLLVSCIYSYQKQGH